MNEIFKGLLGSFNNSPDGASGKKLTAFFSTLICFITPIVLWTYWAFTHNDWSLLTTILAIVSSFITLLFGINELGKTKDKNTNDNNQNPTENE